MVDIEYSCNISNRYTDFLSSADETNEQIPAKNAVKKTKNKTKRPKKPKQKKNNENLNNEAEKMENVDLVIEAVNKGNMDPNNQPTKLIDLTVVVNENAANIQPSLEVVKPKKTVAFNVIKQNELPNPMSVKTQPSKLSGKMNTKDTDVNSQKSPEPKWSDICLAEDRKIAMQMEQQRIEQEKCKNNAIQADCEQTATTRRNSTLLTYNNNSQGQRFNLKHNNTNPRLNPAEQSNTFAQMDYNSKAKQLFSAFQRIRNPDPIKHGDKTDVAVTTDNNVKYSKLPRMRYNSNYENQRRNNYHHRNYRNNYYQHPAKQQMPNVSVSNLSSVSNTSNESSYLNNSDSGNQSTQSVATIASSSNESGFADNTVDKPMPKYKNEQLSQPNRQSQGNYPAPSGSSTEPVNKYRKSNNGYYRQKNFGPSHRTSYNGQKQNGNRSFRQMNNIGQPTQE